MKKSNWYNISVRIEEAYQDSLIGQLTALGFNGFLQEDKFINCYLKVEDWTVRIKKDFLAILKRFGQDITVLKLPFSITLISGENWNKTWEKGIGIIEATPGIIIKPTWKKIPSHNKNKIIINIDPKMSFGTGHHETTRLSLRLLERYVKPKMKVLDFGCGTGILGIASVKLGAQSALAIDNDEWAVMNTRENMRKNGVKQKVSVLLGGVDVIPRRKYDLIIANIDYPTISRYIKHISSHIIKQGIIIFSGILKNDMNALLPLLKYHSLIPLEVDNENEWVATALRKL